MATFITRWRLPLTAILFAHGIGHTLFLFPLLGFTDWGKVSQSWLLGGGVGQGLGQGVAVVVGSLLWTAAIVGFVAVALGLVQHSALPRRYAVIGALTSLAGIGLFWANPVDSSAAAAALVDVVVLVAAWRLAPLAAGVTHS